MFSFDFDIKNNALFSRLRLAKEIFKKIYRTLCEKISFVSRTLIQKIKLAHYTDVLV